MIKVTKVSLKANLTRLGLVVVKYYDLYISCDLCLYKNERFWIRMPEIWDENAKKRTFVFWDEKEKSDEFQKEVLKQIFEMHPLTIEEGAQLRKKFFVTRK